MSHGNLEGKIVAFDFWPACENCRFFEACKIRPRHPAYPHSWHWGREFAAFAEGYLITRSWVGTDAIGHAHTGCKSYEVDPQHVSEPQIQEKGKLESEMRALESKTAWTKNDEDFHARLFSRFCKVLKQRDALRSMTTGERPLSIAVNE
jgi:hypothetical protein